MDCKTVRAGGAGNVAGDWGLGPGLGTGDCFATTAQLPRTGCGPTFLVLSTCRQTTSRLMGNQMASGSASVHTLVVVSYTTKSSKAFGETEPKLTAGSKNKGTSRDEERLLSVLMPLFNEEEFVGASIQRVLEAPLPEGIVLELVVVDDGSTD